VPANCERTSASWICSAIGSIVAGNDPAPQGKEMTPRYVPYFMDEMTMKEIGSVLGIHESRVSQIHKSALEKMAATLQATGNSSNRAF
jgi:Sigma-70, region 4